MKKLIICIALLLLCSTSAFAEHNGITPDEKQLPIVCGDTEHVIENIKKKYNEEIVMLAAGVNAAKHDLFHSLWINNGTGTWSFLAVNKNMGVTCIISSGKNLKMMFPSSRI